MARARHKSGIYDWPRIISAGESRTGNKMLPVQHQLQQQHVADVRVMHEDYHVICSRTRGRWNAGGTLAVSRPVRFSGHNPFFGCQLQPQHAAASVVVVVVYQWQPIGDAFDDVESWAYKRHIILMWLQNKCVAGPLKLSRLFLPLLLLLLLHWELIFLGIVKSLAPCERTKEPILWHHLSWAPNGRTSTHTQYSMSITHTPRCSICSWWWSCRVANLAFGSRQFA